MSEKPDKREILGASDHRIYISSGIRKPNGKLVQNIDSILCRYRRKFLSLRVGSAAANQSLERNNAVLAESMNEYRENMANLSGKSYMQHVAGTSRLECFFLTALPESEFSKMLTEMKICEKEVTFAAIAGVEMLCFCQYLHGDTSMLALSTQLGVDVSGRGNGWKTLELALTVVRKLHAAAQAPDPTEEDVVKTYIKNVKSEYMDKNAAPSFDFNLTLPCMFDALWMMDDKCHLEKLRDWTAILLSMPMMARPSELCEYCPLVENIKLPEHQEQWDADNVPSYINVSSPA